MRMDLFKDLYPLDDDFVNFDLEVDALAFGRVCTRPDCPQSQSGELITRLICPVCGSPTFGFIRFMPERTRSHEPRQ